MKDIKNLSQLKKALKTGATFTFTDHWRKERIGQHRVVKEAQTNGIYSLDPDNPNDPALQRACKKAYWMDFGKAADWTFHDGYCRNQPIYKGKPIDDYFEVVVD